MNKEDIIKQLGLELHPLEGGYFKRTYQSDLMGNCEVGKRRWLTAIYYMLTDDQPIGYMHRNHSDILHFYHCGSPVEYTTLSPGGEIERIVLGGNVQVGEVPQFCVKGGYWKMSRLLGGEFTLLSEAVVPGFEYQDNELATRASVQEQVPDCLEQLLPYIKE